MKSISPRYARHVGVWSRPARPRRPWRGHKPPTLRRASGPRRWAGTSAGAPALSLRKTSMGMKQCVLLLPVACVLFLACVFLSGCGDASHWYSRTFYNVDCRPEKLVHGKCVTPQKGGAHAQTAPTP